MKIRCLALTAAFVALLPCAGWCGDAVSVLRPTELRGDAFARAAWKPEASTFRLGNSNLSLGVGAGPRGSLRTLSGNDVQPMFPMLSMGLGHNAQLAVIPLAGRGGSGAMLAVHLQAF